MRHPADSNIPHPSRGAAPPPRGITLMPKAHGRIRHLRLLPRATLVPYLAHFWEVTWSLDIAERVETLPHPSVHIVFEHAEGHEHTEGPKILGVATRRFSRSLTGTGTVFGIKFRPGTFRAVYPNSLHTLRNRTIPLASIFGDEAATLSHALWRTREFETRIAIAESVLERWLEGIAPALTEVRELVERIASDSTLTRVEDVARVAGLDCRSLQRRFRELVGVSPKWVVQRYRLHEAASRLMQIGPPRLSELAAELGYSDQAHFTRDFTRSVGCTPRQFIARATAGP